MRKSVIRRGAFLAAAFSLPIITGISEAGAISFSERMPDGKLCRVLMGEAHIHAANGARPDKTAAQVKAIRDWSSFTVFEYGQRWGSWSHAVQHSMKCTNDMEAGVWRCRAEAQPCKVESPQPMVHGYIAREHDPRAVGPRTTGCSSWLSCVRELVPVSFDWLRR